MLDLHTNEHQRDTIHYEWHRTISQFAFTRENKTCRLAPPPSPTQELMRITIYCV
jgi:hypothetical protein